MKSEMECEYPTANVSTHLVTKFSGLVNNVCTSFLHMKMKANTHDRAHPAIRVIMTTKNQLRRFFLERITVKMRR